MFWYIVFYGIEKEFWGGFYYIKLLLVFDVFEDK